VGLRFPPHILGLISPAWVFRGQGVGKPILMCFFRCISQGVAADRVQRHGARRGA